MKQILIAVLFTAILNSCRKGTEGTVGPDYLHRVKLTLKDSLAASDFNELDFSKVLLNKVDSTHLYFVRIPLKGKSFPGDFVIVKTSDEGTVQEGRRVHLEGGVIEFGEGAKKAKTFEGRITTSWLNKMVLVNSGIERGYFTALHFRPTSRESVYGDNSLPEVVVVAYVHKSSSVDYSTLLSLNSLFYNSDNGGEDVYGRYYGSLEGGGGGGSSAGEGNYGNYGDSDTGIRTDETVMIDMDTYVDHPAIDVEKYLKCFDMISDVGAICSIEIFTDIPVDNDPTKLFNWQTEAPGHVFLQLRKSNGSSMVQQNIGFYPKSNWKNILSADPVESKLVDDAGHEANASLKMNLNPNLFRSAIGKIKELSSSQYDIDEFNCTDFALQVFNYVRTPLQIPKFVLPGGFVGSNTPQGLYYKLKQMKENREPEGTNVSIGFVKEWVGNSDGPYN